MELTSACTCPKGYKARNITGHGQDCPCYAEWYRRYAPKDAGPHLTGEVLRMETITRDEPAPDQVGPPAWIGADWPVSDPANPDAQLRASQHVSAQLAGITPDSLQAAIGPTPGSEDEGDEDGGRSAAESQPTGR